MRFHYAGFISYCNAQGRLVSSFVEQVKEALSDELGTSTHDPIYVDTERLKPGSIYNRSLACALCRSACLLVIYSPQYRASSFCQRELLAMKRLQEQRLHRLRQTGRSGSDLGMIIPLVLRDWEGMPEDIKIAQACNFSSFTLAERRLSRNPRRIGNFVRIARHIEDLQKQFLDVDDAGLPDCDQYLLPEESEVQVHVPAPTGLPFSQARP